MMDFVLVSWFFFSSRRRHTRFKCDWSSDVCSSDLVELVRVVADTAVHMTAINDGSAIPTSPSPLTPEVMVPVETVTRRLWPGVPVIPLMETGATDGAYLRADGIPTYGVSGVFIDIDDVRAHGRDERIIVSSFYDGVEYIYQLVREFGTGR